MGFLLNELNINCIQFVVVAILLVLIAYYRKSLNPLYAAGLLLPLVILDMAVLSISAYFVSNHQEHLNFGGKLLEVAWPLSLVFILKVISAQAIGLKWPAKKIQLFTGALIGTSVAILFFVIEKLWFIELLPHGSISVATLLYEFLIPGLSEELVYRGVFLAILNHYLGYQWKFFNTRLGWGFILVSLMFVMAHEIVWTGNIPAIIDLVMMALIYGYLREKTNSIWPSVLCHSCADGVYYLLSF